MKVKLTEGIISTGLVCSEGKRREELVDSIVQGMFVEVRATSQGQGTYYFRYKDADGHTQTKKLGRTTDITLAAARSHAKELRAQVALGDNPRAAEKAKKLVITFDTLFYDHYLPYVKPRKRSWDRDEELYRLRIKNVFGSKRLNQVSRLQIQTFHSGLLEEGLATASANHHAKLIRHTLNLAVEWEMLDKNPASRIHMFAEDNKVERLMTKEQLSSLLEVLRTDSRRSVCLIALFLLATACRVGEALSAQWTQFDLENRIWRIPATNSKSKRMRPVPLNDIAFEVINQLNTKGVYENLFINTKSKAPYKCIANVWHKLRVKAGLPSLRCHDLRHNGASALINSGSSLYIVQQILGHSSPSVTQRYAHLSVKSLNDASDNASAIFRGAMKQEPSVIT